MILFFTPEIIAEENNSEENLILVEAEAISENREIFTEKEIASSNAADFPSFMQSAGIQLLSYGTYGLESKPSIRGFTDETVRVVIDGLCVNNAQYGTFDFSTLNLDNIEKIEIVRGGFTEGVNDEGAVGGTIFISTKKNLQKSITFNTALKTFFNKNAPVDAISQNFGFSYPVSKATSFSINAKAVWAQNKYLFENYRHKISQRENADVKDGNLDFSISHSFRGRSTIKNDSSGGINSSGSENDSSGGLNSSGGELTNVWKLNNSFYLARKEIPGPENSKTPGLQKDFDNRLSFALDLPDLIEDVRLSMNAGLLTNVRFYDEKADSTSGRTISSSRHVLNTGTLNASADFLKFSFLTQKAGISANLTHLDSTDSGNRFLPLITLSETSIFYIGNYFSISVPLAIKFSDTNFAFVPKLALHAETKYVDFILSGYRMVQFPNMDDLYWGKSATAEGNPDLKPEKGWGAEFTIKTHDWFLPATLNVFTNYYEDKIQWAASGIKWSPKNVASAFYVGVDFSFEKEFFEILKIRGNFEYLYNRLMDESNKLTYGKKIMWTPDIVASLTFSVNAKDFFVSVEGNFVGEKFTDNQNLYKSNPYFLLNATAELKMLKHFVPYIRAENILNARYQAVPDYPMAGISMTIGCKGKF